MVAWPNEEATGPVSGVRIPRVIVLPWAALAPDVPEPAAPVELDELQAVATPDTRMVTTAAASNLILVGIILKNLPLGHPTAGVPAVTSPAGVARDDAARAQKHGCVLR